MSRCRAIQERILRSLDLDLPLEQDLALDEHLRQCGECADFRRQAQALDTAFARLPEPPVAQLDLERSLASIRASIDASEQARGTASRRRRRASAGIAAGVAALLLAGAFAWWALHAKGPADTETAWAEAPAAWDPPAGAESLPLPDGAPLAQPAAEDESVDEERLARVRADLRSRLEALAPAFSTVAAPWEAPPAEGVAAALEPFVEQARALQAEGWPVARLVEGLLGDSDAAVCCAAARYLGLHGDRGSLARLERELDRREGDEQALRRLHVALAFADAGEAGLEGLAGALEDESLRPIAARAIAAVGGAPGARAMEGALRRWRGPPPVALLHALAALGEEGLASIEELSIEGTVGRDAALDAVAASPAAARYVSTRQGKARGAAEEAFVLAAVGRLRGDGADVAWVEERCFRRELRGEALDCLARIESPAAVASLLDIDASGRVPHGETLQTLALLARESPGALDRYLSNALAAADPAALERLVEMLAASEEPRAAPALIQLSGSSRIDAHVRALGLLAAGELGGAAEADRLAELFPRLRVGDRLVAAAALVALRALRGEEGLRAALGEGAAVELALSVFAGADRRSVSASTLFKLARQLEPCFDPREGSLARLNPRRGS